MITNFSILVRIFHAYNHVFLFVTHLEVALLGAQTCLHSILVDNIKVFSTMVVLIYKSINTVIIPIDPHLCKHLLYQSFYFSNITSKLHFDIVILICISLIITEIEHNFICLLRYYILFVNWLFILSHTSPNDLSVFSLICRRSR